MDLANIGGFTLTHLSSTNVILGKNGCGKSHLLKEVESHLQNKEGFGRVRYISPERGGVLKFQPNIDQAIGEQANWLIDARRRNQSENFRQQSATLFRRLELLVLRTIEKDHVKENYKPRNFDEIIESLNTLLDRVRLERDDNKAFKIIDRDTGADANPETISSGEAELISLGIEFLAFKYEAAAGGTSLLFVDEPDVHLHPDLQDRLARFIVSVLKNTSITLILATHSTALVAALAESGETRIAFMRRKDTHLIFKDITDVDRSILPMFGAHPLSNVFNNAPILLIEGEDDERVWQQAVRSSRGQIRLYPCVVDGNSHFSEFETEVNNIIEAVYDNARAYSLRDRDTNPELIDNLGRIVRMRLSCRAAENLMLSDEVLNSAGVDWPIFQQKMADWVASNPKHQYFEEVKRFVESGPDRKNHDLKDIRNILVGLMSNKPWEVLVGKALAIVAGIGAVQMDGSLRDFLGEKTYQLILGIKDVI